MADNRPLALDPANVALLATLEVAVPLLMLELRRMPADKRNTTAAQWAQLAATTVAHRGDQLMFRTARRYPTTGTCVHCGQSISRTGRGVWRHNVAGADPVVRCDPDALTAYRRKRVAPAGSIAVPADDGGGTGDTFGWLARGLAALAHAPGGVTFGGLHWCADHSACEAVEAETGVPAPAPALRLPQWPGGEAS